MVLEEQLLDDIDTPEYPFTDRGFETDGFRALKKTVNRLETANADFRMSLSVPKPPKLQ